MAEGFARAYGADVLIPSSAGLAPAISVAALTHKVMLEKNIDLGHAYPKSMEMVKGSFDLIINMSGQPLPDDVGAPVEEWTVQDPIGRSEEVYREVRDQIEQRVMRLVLAMRARKPPQSEEGSLSTQARVDTQRHPPRQ
jgi:arsenate reductase (thioredoxin)